MDLVLFRLNSQKNIVCFGRVCPQECCPGSQCVPVRTLKKVGGRCLVEELKRERIIFQTFFFLGGGTSKPLKGLVVFCFFDFGRGGFFLEVHRKREGDVMFFFCLRIF